MADGTCKTLHDNGHASLETALADRIKQAERGAQAGRLGGLNGSEADVSDGDYRWPSLHSEPL